MEGLPARPDQGLTSVRRLRDLGPAPRGLLAVLTIAALALRVWHHHGLTPQGDDIGTLYYLNESYGFLLTHFRDPWLSMNAYMAFAKAIHDTLGTGALVLPSLLAGSALVPWIAALALRIASVPAALAAAALVACNPYLVDQSSDLRAYALFSCAVVAAIVAALDWAAHPSTAGGIRTSAWCTIAVLLHANGIYILAPVAFLMLVPMGQPMAAPGARRSAMKRVLVSAGAGAVVVGAAYAPLWQDLVRVRSGWVDAPPTTVAWIPGVLTTYFGTGWFVLPLATLLGIGAWAAVRHGSPAQALLALIVISIAEMSFAGLSHFPWGHARLASYLLPVLLLLAAVGACAVTGTAVGRSILVALVLASQAPGLADLAARKRDYPWASVAESIRSRALGECVFVQLDHGQVHPLHQLRPLLGDGVALGPSLDQLVRTDPTAVRTLVVVNPHEPITTDAPSRVIGKVQLVTYGPLPTRALAEALVADLERSLGDAPTPERTGHYRVLLDVRRALGRPDDDGRLTEGYYECLARTRRQRFQPPQKLAPVEQ